MDQVMLKNLVERYRTDKMLLDKSPEHKELLKKRMNQHKEDIVNYVTSDSFQPQLNFLNL